MAEAPQTTAPQPEAAPEAPAAPPEAGGAPPHDLMQWALRLLVYPLFFTSGAAGLIYEVVWTRLLLDRFGAGLYAVCAVLAAYMAGLALGSWMVGRAADRLAHPLRLYGGLECAIGICGFLIPTLLRGVGLVDGWAYRHWSFDVFGFLTIIRFVLAFLIMLVPTTLMGATLPVLSRFLVREKEHLGLHVGGLYAMNTFGAVAGTFAAGFVLIITFGLSATEWLAAGVNLTVGAAALLISAVLPARRPEEPFPSSAAPAREEPLSGEVRWVLFTALVSGGVALAAQVLWCRALVFDFEYLKNTTYAFTAMLTVFLLGLALGSSLIGLVIDRQREPFFLYGVLLTMIGLAIFFSVIILYYGARAATLRDPIVDLPGTLDWPVAVANVTLQSLCVLGLPTLLMGMAFPAAVRVVARAGRVGGDVGRLYALNTLGAIAGSILAGFAIVPKFGLTNGLLLLGGIDAALGIVTLAVRTESRGRAKMFAVLALVMLAVTYVRLPKDRGLQALQPLEKTVFYQEGPLATVSVIETLLGDRTIYVDGIGVAGTDAIMQTDQKSLAHIPLMLLPNAKSFLTVGFGSGGCSYSLLLHDQLERVDCAEICRTVPEASGFGGDPDVLEAANHGFLQRKDPRYHILFDDARAYLTHTEQRYDVIATDCTDLRYKSNANLYDLEYFQACRDRLTSQGLVVVWMPLGGLAPDIFKVALRTFHNVFPAMGVFFMDNKATHYILLVGWQHQIEMDYRDFASSLGEADVRADLGELYLDDPVKLLSCFITGGKPLDDYLAGDVINTENNPIIEFESPKYGYGDQSVIDNLDSLMKIRVSPLQFLKKDTLPEAERARLAKYEQALPFIVAGHAAYRHANPASAAEEYMKAAALTPGDLDLTRELLSFPELQRRVQVLEDHKASPFKLIQARLLLGRAFMVQPDKRAMAREIFVKAAQELRAKIADPQEAPDEKRTDEAAQRAVAAWLIEIDKESAPAARAPQPSATPALPSFTPTPIATPRAQ